MSRRRSQTCFDTFLCFLIPAVIVGVWFLVDGYAPFGGNSLATMDADIQYLDLFAYLKRVLSGEDWIAYSFGKTLGGNNVAVFAYYLASPLNALIAFFPKTDLPAFIDLLVLIKIALAGAMFRFFLYGRFTNEDPQGAGRIPPILLSVGYALSQYNLSQGSNVMWLDGVYLLPVILLGVYRLVRERKGMLLALSVGCSVLFNWYTGGMNCVFAILWFLFECSLFAAEQSIRPDHKAFRALCRRVFHFVGAMAIGIMLSAALFLPTILAMQSSTRGSLELGLIKQLTVRGDLRTILTGQSVGAISADGELSLFCGSLAIIGCMLLFLARNVRWRIKVVMGLMLVTVILSFFWMPLYACFSLFKAIHSYWYRHAYQAVFSLLFIAAYAFVLFTKEKIRLKRLIPVVALFCAMRYLVGVNENTQGELRPVISCVLLMLVAASLCLSNRENKTARRIGILLLVCVVLSEAAIESRVMMWRYHIENVHSFAEYVSESEVQIRKIHARDNDLYRISQTSTRVMTKENLTANYNEALAYGYRSISGYTSNPDDIQREFLERVGYRMGGDNMNIVNTSVIGADVLFGVRYLLSAYSIEGYQPVKDLGTYNGKGVYENPYALPLSFCYEGGAYKGTTPVNPFQYQNQLFSELLGRGVTLYVPMEHKVVSENPLTYEVMIPKGDFVAYGNLPWHEEREAVLRVGDAYETAYARWDAPSVFYIPCADEMGRTRIVFEEKGASVIERGSEQFYALNLAALEKASEELRRHPAEIIRWNDGEVRLRTNEPQQSNLLISLAADPGWHVRCDGEPVEPELVGNCLYSIPIKAGEHEICMTYHVRGVRIGACLTVAAALFLALKVVRDRRAKAELAHWLHDADRHP